MKKDLHIKIDESLLNSLKNFAEYYDLSLSAFVRLILKRYKDEHTRNISEEVKR